MRKAAEHASMCKTNPPATHPSTHPPSHTTCQHPTTTVSFLPSLFFLLRFFLSLSPNTHTCTSLSLYSVDEYEASGVAFAKCICIIYRSRKTINKYATRQHMVSPRSTVRLLFFPPFFWGGGSPFEARDTLTAPRVLSLFFYLRPVNLDWRRAVLR